jgi:hypothetical protein
MKKNDLIFLDHCRAKEELSVLKGYSSIRIDSVGSYNRVVKKNVKEIDS